MSAAVYFRNRLRSFVAYFRNNARPDELFIVDARTHCDLKKKMYSMAVHFRSNEKTKRNGIASFIQGNEKKGTKQNGTKKKKKKVIGDFVRTEKSVKNL